MKLLEVRVQQLILVFLFLWASKALATTGEPLPVFSSLYASVYEQKALLRLIESEETDVLQLLLASGPSMDLQKENKIRKELTHFISRFKKKDRYSDEYLLEQLLFRLHRKYLKEYQPYQDFYGLLENGRYNCVTSTALYAWFLEELNFDYRIIETDYHIFLMAKKIIMISDYSCSVKLICSN